MYNDEYEIILPGEEYFNMEGRKDEVSAVR